MSLSSHIDGNSSLKQVIVKDLLKDSKKTFMKIVGDSIYLVFLS